MRCDGCGRKIRRGKAVRDTVSVPTGPATRCGQRTGTVFVTLCPECGERRAHWGNLALVLVGLILFGGVAIVIGALLR
jgi:hypothetical protein